MISFGREIQNYLFASKREFLLTSENGYCSSSIAGNTRKYHGLLVRNNRVLLSSLDEFVNGKRISVAAYNGQVMGHGLQYLCGFKVYPPQFYYEVDGCILQKTVEFNGKILVRYELFGDAEIKVIPLVTDRNIHEIRECVDFKYKIEKGRVRMDHLILHSKEMNFIEDPDIYWNVWYREDFERGYSCQENLFTPGHFTAKGNNITVNLYGDVPNSAHETSPSKSNLYTPMDYLQHSANDFNHSGMIYAGYHWFVEPWGRDTFISLSGLFLEQGKFNEAKFIFKSFAKMIRKGLVPNKVPDNYWASDSTLWFIHALHEYTRMRGCDSFIRDLKPLIREILFTYPESEITSLNNDLISVAPRSTWMDTRYTPRSGKPVEVNALWIEALQFAELLDIPVPVSSQKSKKAFSYFWNSRGNYLYDVIDPLDTSLRPNQVIPIALGLVDREVAILTLDTIRRHLFTPFGLRTLAPYENAYKGRFTGDESYHNGSVWPWLMGFFIEALLRYGEPAATLSPVLHALFMHINDAGLGTISEFFDGDLPHEPRGCIAQAWSVAELIRANNLIQRGLCEKSNVR